ncbi:Probable cytosol aminopeptidase [Seminavis robusta]|uniref:leucyl aminopeptidase n=1 Tax=Seminavis robusta TaxID=568900 RepID=A0A9N8ETN3_9STRA|nr:Probable cytosol aminopeptidase [Seminavis robusta]|eukprot:Sro1732_g294150.1 Probable cytosol aminopeptidase (633) ;mRNA; f:5035-7110
MEWNTQPPIDFSIQETLQDAADYDCIVIGIIEYNERSNNDDSNNNNTTTCESIESFGSIFHAVDNKYSGILSKWMEGKDDTLSVKSSTKGEVTTFTSPKGRTPLDSAASPKRKRKRKYDKDWDEVSKVCKVSLDGHMEVQRLVVCRIKGDPNSLQHAGKLGRSVGNRIASHLKNEGERWALLMPPPPPSMEKNASDTSSQPPLFGDFVSEMTTSLWSTLYKDIRFKSKDKRDNLAKKEDAPFALDLIWDHHTTTSQSTTVVEDSELPTTFLTQARQSISKGEIIASGVFLTKDIVNAPHNVLNSVSLAETAKRLAAEYPRQLTCHVMNADDCEKLGMGAFLGVARGSETPPQFIHMIYRPGKSSAGSSKRLRKLGVVGKGLLFDTGGYNIKRGMMELMKFDCGGAAAVLGAARAIAQLAPEDVEVHFVVAACENMVNERAMVPGDILTASNGKTIEVMNTDAEGRLTMADALAYVDQKVGCEEIVEMSTLTGACMVALGNKVAGLWAKDDALAEALVKASKMTGEKVWRMPLEEEYKEGLKSKFADLNNIGGKYAGAISAALFLNEFVEGNKPYAHIDMAGPVWATKAGATGWGARLLIEWICQCSLLAKDAADPATPKKESNKKKRPFSLF